MAKLPPFGPFRAFDKDGHPLAGGKLYTYEARTVNPKATYTDSTEGTINNNPVILDANGYASVWLGSGAYKWVLTDAYDVPQWPFPMDDIAGTTESAFGSQIIETDSNLIVTAPYQSASIIGTDSLTLTLIPASEAGEGFYFTVKNSGNGVVSIDPDGSETVDGLSTISMTTNQTALIICNGEKWYSFFLYQIPDAETVPYDHADSGLTADNVQDAIDEVVDDIEALSPNFVQIGTVEWGLWATAPARRLELNGATGLSRTTYAALYAHLNSIGLIVTEGTKQSHEFGNGNGTTTFSLADYRDLFPRAKSAVRAIGSYQADAFQGHFHQAKILASAGAGVNNTPAYPAGNTTSNDIVTVPITDGTNGTPRTANETRPKNIALMATIKY